MYKLVEYESKMTKLFIEYAKYVPIGDSIFKFYNEVKPESLESSYLYALYLNCMMRTNFELYDSMREKFPDFNDAHLHTLLRNSFYAAFHCTVNEIYNAEIIARSYNIRDF